MANVIRAEDLTENTFKMIGNEWFLVAAEKDSKVNAMTASWGAFGVLWQKNSAFIFIRDSRFTQDFVDSSETFSLSVINHAEYADMLVYMGKVSGRDEDKIAQSLKIMMTNPNTLGIFEEKVLEISKLMHDNGSLLYLCVVHDINLHLTTLWLHIILVIYTLLTGTCYMQIPILVFVCFARTTGR